MADFSKLVITNKGRSLIAKVIANTAVIEFTKVSASSEACEVEGLENLEELTAIHRTTLISSVSVTNNTSVEIQAAFTNMEVEEGYYLRVLGLYANDPDEGEILYGVTAETSGNCYIPAYNGVTSSGIYLQFVTTVGNAENVSLEINPAAIATIGDVENITERLKIIDFDDTGEVEGIGSFTDFMSSFVKETSIYQLFANMKAGLKYVLHKDMLVNNCVTDNPDLPLTAAQGKELQDQITQLYSDLGGFEPIIDETGKITGYKTTAGGADTVFPFSEIDKALLVNALKHSGLGITTESTAEYIYQRLSQAFPYSLYILQGGSIKKSFVWNLSKTNGNAQFTASGGTINTFFDSEAYVTYTATSSKILFDEYAKNIVLNVGNIYYAGNRPNAYHNVTMYVNDINKGTQAITANGTNTWAINDVVKSVYFVVTIYHGYHTINVSLNNIYLQN